MEPLKRLSKREREVVALVALGFTNRQIGDALGISQFTVRNHLVKAARKAGTSNRTQLAMLSQQGGAS